MNVVLNNRIETTINALYHDAKSDFLRVMRGAAKSVFRPLQPADFKEAYLAISYEQGRELVKLTKAINARNIVEFGTSFGISTLFLAQGAVETGGKIITTELIASKAQRAWQSFKQAGVAERIDLRVGDALETLIPFTKWFVRKRRFHLPS